MACKTCLTVYNTLGRTVSGKTTISKYLSAELNLTYISEAKLKRNIIERRRTYNAKDSLNEELRDKAYKTAISICEKCLQNGSNLIIDASFHKKYRRQWLYNLISVFTWSEHHCNIHNLQK